MTLRIGGESLLDITTYLERLPGATKRAARLAINDTMSRKAVQAIRLRMAQDVQFPAGYLTDPKRLGVARLATDENLEAAIVGRETPTSLARFSIGGTPGARGGVTVAVKPGGGRLMTRAFLLRLRQGAELTENAFNLGLAIRLRPGETLANKRVMAKAYGMGKSGLYLLYGPSVDQVFRDISAELAPSIADSATSEFLRQFERLSREL